MMEGKIAWRDVVLTALAPVIWGSTYIITSEWLPPNRPFTSALIRVIPAGLLLVLVTQYFPKRAYWYRLMALSLLNIGLFQALLFVAAYRLPGGLAAVLSAIQPLLVMLLAWSLDQQSPSPYSVAACALGVFGMAVLLLSPQTIWEPIGIMAALIGAASMATGTYLTRRWQMNISVLAITGWQLLIGGLMLVPLAWLVDMPLPKLTLLQVGAYSYLSLAGALLAYALWFRGIARLPSVAVASLGLLSPLTAVILGWTLLGQSITGTAMTGMILVLVSIVLVQMMINRPVKKKVIYKKR